MEKIEIIQKDRENYIENEAILLEIEYSFLGKFFALLLRISGILVGLFFLFGFQSYIVKIFAIIFIVFFILDFLNILFFKRLVFYTNFLLKESLLKKSYLNYSILQAMVSKRFFGGILSFREKNNRLKNLFFSIDLLPISNKDFKQIKTILIKKKVIKGDEYEWND